MVGQLSFVLLHLKRKLSLASIKRRDISVQKFDKIDSGGTSEQVELCFISNDDKEIPSNYFVKDFCTSLTSQNLNLVKT